MKRRAVLFIAHPGHELLVHHWMERERPLVLVLTDGSGRAGEPRLEDTRRIVTAAGAVPGPICGVAPDSDVYRAILARDVDFFERLLEQATDAMIDCKVELVVSDPIEACEPVHDLTAVVARLAVARAAASAGRRIEHFEFPIEGRPPAATSRPKARMIDLDAAAARRKLVAVRSVPALGIEFDRLVEADPSLVDREWLTPVAPDRPLLPRPEGEPFYERQGRERVAQGVFREVITYAGHVAPLVVALARLAGSSMGREPAAANAG